MLISLTFNNKNAETNCLHIVLTINFQLFWILVFDIAHLSQGGIWFIASGISVYYDNYASMPGSISIVEVFIYFLSGCLDPRTRVWLKREYLWFRGVKISHFYVSLLPSFAWLYRNLMNFYFTLLLALFYVP